MSDLVSPILYVLKDEALTFWCFVSLMERMEANFNTDCTGMHAQLAGLRSLVQLVDPQLYAFLDARECLNFFFCYRWLLVHFKREFAFEEVSPRCFARSLFRAVTRPESVCSEQ